MKKLLVVPALLAKAHYDSYTKKDGTFVQAHDDKRQAAAPKQVHSDHAFDQIKAAGGQSVRTTSGAINYAHGGKAKSIPHKDAPDGNRYVDHDELQRHLAEMKPAGEPAASPKMVLPKKKAPAADPYGHPNVVGKAEKLQGGAADKAHGFHFAGKEFSASGKEGTSFHDGTPVRHFRELTESGEDSGEHLWLDHSARVHADDTSSVKKLRAQYEAHAKKPAGGAMGPDEVKQHAVAAGAKFRSNVSVFSKPELAHSFANQTQGSKGSAFVMKHPDHQHHVVVGGADAQRMEKNGYEHVRPGA